MAVNRGYKPGGEDWWDTPEGMKFLKEREANSEFDREADKLLVEKIEKGNIIVTSWTAPWLTKRGFKVWLTASSKTRSERMSTRDETSHAHSAKVVSERDTKHHKLYMDLYQIDMGNDLSPFDLIIDTDNRTPEQVADIVLDKIKR
jgi:CMP/dCMP kinase